MQRLNRSYEKHLHRLFVQLSYVVVMMIDE